MPNPVIDLMADHRTVRDYRPVRLDRGQLEEAVRAAQMAATSSNVQAYCVINVTTAETRRRLADWRRSCSTIPTRPMPVCWCRSTPTTR